MVFFDTFCPDLHLPAGVGHNDKHHHDHNERRQAATNSAVLPKISGGDVSSSTPPCNKASSLLAACSWCSARLGNAEVILLSENADKGFQHHCQASGGREREGGVGGGGGVGGVRAMGLQGFLEAFVGKEAREELGRRGDLLRRAHLSHKVCHRIKYFEVLSKLYRAYAFYFLFLFLVVL